MKNILITGSTDGIGKLAAEKLANDGHRIYLHGRNADKLNTVIAELKAATGNDNISGFVADFSDMNAVRQMATQVTAELDSLDVLINNAGIFKTPVEQTVDGYDIRFAVNYFAPFILTEALLPLLNKTDAPRVVNLSSAAQATVSLNTVAGKEFLGANATYAQSKLALTMWNNYLAQTEPKITFVAVNPGSLLNTNMAAAAYGQYWSSADKGGNILYELAVSNEYADASSKYFNNDKGDPKGAFDSAHPDAYNAALIEALITKTHELLS